MPSKPPPARVSSARFTLRRKLTASLMSVGLASLCVAGLVYFAWDALTHNGALQGRVELLAEHSAWTWQEARVDPVRDGSWMRALAQDPVVRSAYMIDPEGRVLASYEPDGATRASAPREAGLFEPSARRDVFRAGQRLGSIVVQASAEPLWARARTHGAVFLTLAGISTLITLGLSRRIHHRFSDQLLDLAHAANAISTRKDYSIRAVHRSDDEIGILVDTFNHMITQIELRDQQLKAEVKRAEAARVAKSQFLATMSHEIRTPINGVLGMTQLLLDTPLSGEQTEFAETIHKSAEGLLSIINDILDFSKGEAGRYELEEIPFSPAKVVHECLDTVSIVAAEKKLELCLELDEHLPAQFKGDPARLRQVLLNLLSNALKFTAKGEIVLRILLEEDLGARARIRFEVQDTGIGVPQDRVDRLFQSFSQVDASRSRKYGGTGLGLAISKQIVEAMGGSMFVKTEANQGSTFGFKLQLAVSSSEGEHDRSAPPRSLRILIADPSPTSGATIAKLLREDNLVELAVDVPGARMKILESLKQRAFDLVLIDMRLLPALESLETIGAQACVRIPLVVLAPVNQLAAAAGASWSGRKAALAKPVKRSDLYWCIAEIQRGPLPTPADAEPVEERPEPVEEGASQQRIRVLVAEDHPVNQRITTRFLEKLGVAWQLAANGEEALVALKETPFDLVLMDVQMPVMDGLEATLAIRELEALSGAHVPIIALTANVLEEHRREAQQAGFDDYLAKPLNLEELRAHIQKWAPSRAKVTA